MTAPVAGWMCLDCGHVSERARECSVCASTQVWPLTGWLDGKIPLPGLVREVVEQTGAVYPERAIAALVKRAWPGKFHFSRTQLALVVQAIERRMKARAA